MNKKGFDNSKYINLQSQKIRDRIAQFGDKLYLEFGGKLFDDYHAARVLPGFEPDAKVKMLLELKDEAEVVIVINADAIEKNKRRGDLGITYEQFDNLIDQKEKEVKASNGDKITLDSIIEYLGVEEEITSQYRERVNLLTEVTFKDIPTV